MLAVAIAGWGVLGALLGTITRRLADRLARTQRPTSSIAPPLVFEAITAALLVGLAWRTGAKPELLAYCWLAAVGVPLAATDLAIGRLPNLLVLPSYPAMLGLFGLAAILDHDLSALLRAVAGMAVLGAFNLLVYVAAPNQLGGGDVKLAGLLGLALAWASWSTLLTGTLLGWLLATVTQLVLRVTGRSSAGRLVRMGPFLITGAMAVLLIGGSL